MLDPIKKINIIFLTLCRNYLKLNTFRGLNVSGEDGSLIIGDVRSLTAGEWGIKIVDFPIIYKKHTLLDWQLIKTFGYQIL